MGTPRYSIVIPAYNESERISNGLDRVLEYIRRQQWAGGPGNLEP